MIDALLASGAHTATKYLEPGLVVRVTRPTVKEGRWNKSRSRYVTSGPKLNGCDKRARRVELVVTIGEPNHEAREFIKRCKKADEPFPVKKVQLQFLAKK